MKRAIALAFATVLMFSAGLAEAAEAYTKQAFMAAQQASKPILLHVTAPWCPTCRAQKPVVAEVEKEMPDLMVFEVDFDSQKGALKEFGVTSQSTLIGFSGMAETERSTGVTDPAKIRALASSTKMMMKKM